jgi:hypothetical protein
MVLQYIDAGRIWREWDVQRRVAHETNPHVVHLARRADLVDLYNEWRPVITIPLDSLQTDDTSTAQLQHYACI